jgi:excisionase family DNA binding protein
MSEPRKTVPLKPDALPPDKMIVTMTAGELRALIAEIMDQKLKRLAPERNGLLTVEQAAEFLGYSKDWVFKNWKRIGGKKIGGRGVRFDAADLESWISRGAVDIS